MKPDVAGFVLAAGSGTRLRPLTTLRPKALCPVNNRALVDYAVDRCASLSSRVRVNAWHLSDQMRAHFEERDDLDAHLQGVADLAVESEPLGTAGALGANRDWIDGAAVLVHNADAWHADPIDNFVETWDGERVRLLVTPTNEDADFGDRRFCGVSLMPWKLVEGFKAEPSGLWEVLWRHLRLEEIDLVDIDGAYFDCGTPADYLDANMAASGGESVVSPHAQVEGSVERSVVWPGAHVGPKEVLVDSIRATDEITVDAKRSKSADVASLSEAFTR